MTYHEHQQFEAVEKTCSEIRDENVKLCDYIAELHNELRELKYLNTLGKTKLIADRIQAILK